MAALAGRRLEDHMAALNTKKKLPLASMLRIGGWPLEMAPPCLARLSAAGSRWRLVVWRAQAAPEGLEPACDAARNRSSAGAVERKSF